MALFRLKRSPMCPECFLVPFDWVEVLAIEPVYISKVKSKEKSAYKQRIHCGYVCNTNEGLEKIPEDVLWGAVDSEELIFDETQSYPSGSSS